MRVGLMADSHDRIPAVREFVRIMQEGGVSMLLHAGDYCRAQADRGSQHVAGGCVRPE